LFYILNDTLACSYFCEIMLSSLDELKKHIEEGNLVPIDKYDDEVFTEEINDLEDNRNQTETNLKWRVYNIIVDNVRLKIVFILRRLCLRLGNLRFLSEKVNQSSHFKSLGAFEVLNDIIETTSKVTKRLTCLYFDPIKIFLKSIKFSRKYQKCLETALSWYFSRISLTAIS